MHEGLVREAFERLSADYDERFPRIIPRYHEFHDVIVQRAAAHPRGGAGGSPRAPTEAAPAGGELWIDLGCGTGELSRRLLEAIPGIRLHAVDLSQAMIERARAKLAAWADRVSFEAANVLSATLPAGAAGAVSALAVHHLERAEKRMLFGKLAATLRPGGLFVLGDAVSGGTPEYTAYYAERWTDHMRASGMGAEEIESVLRDHRQNDRFSGLEEHTDWLREAGFERVECLWKHFLLVVVAGETPGRGAGWAERSSPPVA